MIESILRGARSILDVAEASVKSAAEKIGEDGKVVYPETAYFWPTIYGLTGKRVDSIKDLEAEVRELSKTFDERVELENALNAGMASLMAFEIAEAAKYSIEERPYPPPCTGFISDGTLRGFSLRFADGTIPGIVILLGKAENLDDVKNISEGLARMGLLTFAVGPVIDQLRESGVEFGIEKLLVPLGVPLASIAHAVNLAVRIALIFGKIEAGDKARILKYIKDRLRLCAIALGELDDMMLAAGAGAISFGMPLVSDRDIAGLRAKFDIMIDLEKCKKCLDCVRACPKGVLGEKDGLPTVVNPDACDGCLKSVEVCPVEDAITVQPVWPKEFGGSLVSEPNLDLIVRRACERAQIKVAKEVRFDIPVEVSPLNQGESIRKEDLYVEFGRKAIGCELVVTRRLEEIEDEKIEIIGPDLPEMVEGRSYPLGILIEVAGERIEKDFEPIIERHIHEYLNYIRGFMHLGSRNLVWCRVSKRSFERGLRLKHIGKTLVTLFKRKMPFIEKIQVKLFSAKEEVDRLVEEAKRIYAERDARIKGLTDEQVDEFYGCILCQSFAPNHVCVITPERISNCGAITWLDAKTSTRMGGGNFVVPKGEALDAFRGEYAGVNEVVKKMSHGATERVYLYSMFDYPHTSCGCFEALVFYIPEVDGLGVVHREFQGPAVNKLKFSSMAGEAGGGTQVFGFYGIGIEYMRSKKFMRADGGFNRVVWMPGELKERVRDAIPAELYEKIATEDVKDLKELREFLVEKAHPIIERWKAK